MKRIIITLALLALLLPQAASAQTWDLAAIASHTGRCALPGRKK